MWPHHLPVGGDPAHSLHPQPAIVPQFFERRGGAQKEKETEAGAGQQGSSICALWLVSYAYSAPRPFLVPEGYAGDQGLTHFFALCAPAYSKQNAQNFMKNPKQCRQQRRESSKVLPKKKQRGKISR